MTIEVAVAPHPPAVVVGGQCPRAESPPPGPAAGSAPPRSHAHSSQPAGAAGAAATWPRWPAAAGPARGPQAGDRERREGGSSV